MFKLPNIPAADELVDTAFRRGSKTAWGVRTSGGPRKKRMKKCDEERIKSASRAIESPLRKVVKYFPSYDQLPDFHKKLLVIRIDKDRYKKSLGAVQWCVNSIAKLRKEAVEDMKCVNNAASSREFFGRAASMVKQISKDLEDLVEIKAILKDFPMVDDIPTLVVSGYPNVGKSTFMKNLTGSNVKIANYPFTTQNILIGHKTIKYTKYQVIDSPGLLDRPLEDRNPVELQAILAMEELADVILFLIDPAQDAKHQLSLLADIRKAFECEIFVAINKIDEAERGVVDKLVAALAGYKVFTISANDKADCEKTFLEIFAKK